MTEFLWPVIREMIKRNDYNADPTSTAMSYVFDSTIDLSDLKTLKFDFFVDYPNYLMKTTNNIEICIANSRLAKDDYYSWNMDLTNLKEGWNQVSLDLQKAKINGSPDLKEAKSIVLRFTKIDLSKENYEEILIGLDNLRYISSTGNKILKVEGWDSKLDDSVLGNEDNPYIDNDQNATLENNGTIEKEIIEKIVNITGKTKINKTVERTIVTDYLTYGIILGIEAAILLAGIIVFIIVYRRKTKKRK